MDGWIWFSFPTRVVKYVCSPSPHRAATHTSPHWHCAQACGFCRGLRTPQSCLAHRTLLTSLICLSCVHSLWAPLNTESVVSFSSSMVSYWEWERSFLYLLCQHLIKWHYIQAPNKYSLMIVMRKWVLVVHCCRSCWKAFPEVPCGSQEVLCCLHLGLVVGERCVPCWVGSEGSSRSHFCALGPCSWELRPAQDPALPGKQKFPFLWERKLKQFLLFLGHRWPQLRQQICSGRKKMGAEEKEQSIWLVVRASQGGVPS